MNEKREPILFNAYKECCGCSACAAVCPKNAIYLEENEEGFYYPRVDENKCIKCYQCEQVCAFKRDGIQEKEVSALEVYAIKNKNKETIKRSSSGGLFYALSDMYLESGNAVASCIYDVQKKEVVLCIYEDKKSRDSACGSKYIQAVINDEFVQISDWLNNNPSKEMLVIGTGCQIAGLDAYLKKGGLRERAFLVDLICHGAPSPGLWKKYATHVEKKNNGIIEYISFKDKRNGWKNPMTYALINGKEITIKPFADWFYCEWSIRESCYQCPYTKINRSSDMTIGDYWGIETVFPEFYDSMGVSLAIVQNERGKQVLNAISNKLDLVGSNEKECLQPRLISPANKPKNREMFWRDMNQKGISYCEKKYKEENPYLLSSRVKRKINSLLKIFLKQ